MDQHWINQVEKHFRSKIFVNWTSFLSQACCFSPFPSLHAKNQEILKSWQLPMKSQAWQLLKYSRVGAVLPHATVSLVEPAGRFAVKQKVADDVLNCTFLWPIYQLAITFFVHIQHPFLRRVPCTVQGAPPAAGRRAAARRPRGDLSRP